MRQSFRQVLAAALASLFALAAVGRAGADVRHTVSAGETLSYIAGLYGVAVDVLAGINHIANPDLIFPGQVLEIVGGQRDDSGPQNYQVRPGDTLTAISQRFGVSLAALMEANGLTDPDLIVAGETLIIPSPEVSDFVGFLPSTAPSDPELEAIIDEMAAVEGVDPGLVRALAWVESEWRQDAVSPVGAVGVMQVMPGTAAWLESEVFGYPLNEDTSVYDNVKAGVKLLRILLDATGDTELAIAAYYQGQGATASGLMYDDTRAYVKSVLRVKERFWP
jgi:LysM repeat protein